MFAKDFFAYWLVESYYLPISDQSRRPILAQATGV
jgi:hypothetical protein